MHIRLAQEALLARLQQLLGTIIFATILAACGTSDSVFGPNDRSPLSIFVEAEAAVVPGFDVIEDEDASGGQSLVQSGAALVRPGIEVTSVEFLVDVGGSYGLWARINGTDEDSNAVYLGFNGDMRRAVAHEHGSWIWLHVDRQYLTVGEHRVSIGFAGPGLKVDVFGITFDQHVAEEVLEAQVLKRIEREREPRPTNPNHPKQPAPDPQPDEPAPDPNPNDPAPDPEPDEAYGSLRPSMSLRGDASFDANRLDASQRLWFDRMWAAIREPQQRADSWASSGDLYTYGRTLSLHVHHLLTALRVTGDLRLLDEINRLSHLMEARLADEWADGTTDGYRNWLRLRNDDTHTGKDVHSMDEMLTHASVAAVMYALHVNRDLASPGGVNYGKRADFWFDYLKNDFEAKWRARTKNKSGFPLLEKDLAHTDAQWIRYHHYMGLRSGDSRYAAEAARLAQIIDDNFELTSTPLGDAYVWCHRQSTCLNAQRTNYARYTVNAILDLTWEGVAPFTAETHLPRLAATVAHFVADNGTTDLAPDVAGGEVWNGLQPAGNRQAIGRLAPFSLLLAYDRSHELRGLVNDVYAVLEDDAQDPRDVEIPTAMLLDATQHR